MSLAEPDGRRFDRVCFSWLIRAAVTAALVVPGCSGGDANRGGNSGTSGDNQPNDGADAPANDGASGASGTPGDQFDTPRGTPGDDNATPINPVMAKADKADLLFVVDNSGSMVEEQEALRAQFPKLIKALTEGGTAGGSDAEFSAIKDLHLGVVTSDLGLVGVQGVPGCERLGDDGVLQTVPAAGADTCEASYPPFVEFTTGADEAQTAQDFSCVASVGTEGCGFEQQLEVALKALWPSMDMDAFNGDPIVPNRITFLPELNGVGAQGHGDARNMGFLRNDGDEGRSLIAIIIVTDEEDCSSKDTVHFTPQEYLDGSDALYDQPLNLRCFLNKHNLFNVQRYVNGYKTLREGQENLVVFAAIAGVPPDLVDAGAMANVDFTDQASRDAYYQAILDDPRMQEVQDPNSPEGEENLTPSCDTASGKAFPPRRIVEVARSFGEFGVVQSICQEDFGPAMDAIIAQIGYSIGRN